MKETLSQASHGSNRTPQVAEEVTIWARCQFSLSPRWSTLIPRGIPSGILAEDSINSLNWGNHVEVTGSAGIWTHNILGWCQALHYWSYPAAPNCLAVFGCKAWLNLLSRIILALWELAFDVCTFTYDPDIDVVSIRITSLTQILHSSKSWCKVLLLTRTSSESKSVNINSQSLCFLVSLS